MTLRKTFFGLIFKNTRRLKGGAGACLITLLFLLVFHASPQVRAETLNVRITVTPGPQARARVEGESSSPARAWSFRNAYAGMMNLGGRVENFALLDEKGGNVAVKKLGPGQYEGAAETGRFSYDVRMEPPAFETDASHVSWLAEGHGFLMLGDLLPIVPAGEGSGGKRLAFVSFKLPDGWKAVSGEAVHMSQPPYVLMNAERAVSNAESTIFFVGRELRVTRRRVGAAAFSFVTTGEWAFSDGEAADLAENILKDHAETFRGYAQGDAVLMLAPFPRAGAAGHWSAETRGNTTLLLSGKTPSKTAALAQLSFPFAHEIFHLWVPNGLKLDGDYDWFYEGFTLYQALRAGLRLNLLTFQDYLDALGRAFDGYRAVRDGDRGSLIDASYRRWTASPSLVYNKGMLVAFLYDLTLRQRTKGKLSLDEVYRELFSLYRTEDARRDGNQAVLAALKAQGGMQDFTRRYVEGQGQIDLQAEIAPFGLQVDAGGVRTRIYVSDQAGGAQRDLLRKFGYNEKTYGVTRHGRNGR